VRLDRLFASRRVLLSRVKKMVEGRALFAGAYRVLELSQILKQAGFSIVPNCSNNRVDLPKRVCCWPMSSRGESKNGAS
jgi:hypothetical protein